MMVACAPTVEDVTYEDLDVNVSFKQDDADFQQYNTYAVADSVHIITGDENNLDSFALEAVDEVILEEIRNQMDGYGYTEAPKGTTPDVALIVARLVVDHTGGGFTPGYCYPGWGWGWPGYGWCYPGYGYTYNYSTGTIMIDMLDIKNFGGNIGDDDHPVAPWRYIANGYLKSTSIVFDERRVRENVARGFEQSTYLAKD